MNILRIEKYVPSYRCSTVEMLSAFPFLSDRLRNILRDNLGVAYRHSVITLSDLVANKIEPAETCSQLAAQAALKCLKAHSIRPDDINLLIAATDTSDYICPSLAPQLVSLIGLSPHIKYYNLGGLGCSALIKAFELAETHLYRYPDHLVLLVLSEVQSAYADAIGLFEGPILSFGEVKRLKVDEDQRQKMFRKTLSVVQAFLFGDGAVAILLGKSKGRARFIASSNVTNLESTDSTLVYFPEGGSAHPNMSEKHTRPLFVMQTDRVADRGSDYGVEALKELTSDPCWPRQELPSLHGIREWLLHPGSKPVLDAVSSTLMKKVAAARSSFMEMMPVVKRSSVGLSASYRVLSNYGNLSGAALGFILEDVLNSTEKQASPGSYGILLGFGAGFSSSAALIQFTSAL